MGFHHYILLVRALLYHGVFLGRSTLGLRFHAPRRRIISLRMAVGSSLRRFHLLAAVLSGGGFIFARMYPRGRLFGPAGFRRVASLFGLMWAFDTWWHFLLL